MFSIISFSDFKKMMEQKVNQMIESISLQPENIVESEEEIKVENSEKINLLDAE